MKLSSLTPTDKIKLAAEQMFNIELYTDADASQLLDALLVATGKAEL